MTTFAVVPVPLLVPPGPVMVHAVLTGLPPGAVSVAVHVTSLTKDRAGSEVVANVRAMAVLDDPEALARAAACGLGIALLPLPHALPLLDSGELVRVLPDWHADTRPMCIYYSSRRQLPAKVRVFVEYIVGATRARGYALRFGTGQA